MDPAEVACSQAAGRALEAEEERACMGTRAAAATDPHDEGDVGSGSSSIHAPDDWTCAICLSQPAPVDLSTIKGCEHTHCVKCILHWTMYKETPLCPQCKSPFNYLYVHRMLDGTISDYPVEESVCLLKRATWFTEHLQVLDKGKRAGGSTYEPGEFEEEEEDYYEDEIEQYYFSSAAGRARVVIGNRRFGEGGVVRGGRRFARPLPQVPTALPANAGASTSAGTGGKKGKGKGKAAANRSAGEAGPSGSSGGGGSGGGGGGGGHVGAAGGSSSVGDVATAAAADATVLGGGGSGSGVAGPGGAAGAFSGSGPAETGPCAAIPLPSAPEPVGAALSSASFPALAAAVASPSVAGTSAGSSGKKGGKGGGAATGSSCGGGSSGQKMGRRAQRNMRRTAADYEEAYLDEF